MPGLLDVILGYDCNLACDYCTITPAMRRRALATPQVLVAMRAARSEAFDRVAFTGGEPTIRGDLLGLVAAGRRLGFVGIKVQSNGLLLGHGDNAARLAAAARDDTPSFALSRCHRESTDIAFKFNAMAMCLERWPWRSCRSSSRSSSESRARSSSS